MFSPSYQITNKTLTSIAKIEVNSKLVQLIKLQQDWESRLVLDGLIRKTVNSLRFVGNDLRIDDVSKIIKDEPGRDDRASDVALRAGVVGKERDVQQVLNFLNSNKLIEQQAYLSGKFNQGKSSQQELTQINNLLGERLVSSERLGSYRMENKVEIETNSSPLPVEISFQIDDLFGWYKNADKNEIHPVIKAGVMFYELVRICPFEENSLLSSVGYFNLILLSEGFGFKKLSVIEEEVFKNKDSFQTAVQSVSRNSGDLTIWLEFLSKNIGEATDKVVTKVMNLVGEAPIFKSEGGKVISLTERQIAIMEEMTVHGEMTIKEIRSVLPSVSDDTILRDLKDLIAKKLIRKKGKTKGAVYVIGKSRSFK